jgi:hypothetical protein
MNAKGTVLPLDVNHERGGEIKQSQIRNPKSEIFEEEND